jgi:D-alanyl-D-alanine-carboxypeptidase/D-alanyl-D-alanine-endopeptidase
MASSSAWQFARRLRRHAFDRQSHAPIKRIKAAKHRCIVLLAAVTVLATPPVAAATAELDQVARALGHGFIANPVHVGLSIGIIQGGERRTFHFGSTRRGAAVLPTDRTIYELASLTKSYTGMLLARAVIDGKLALHDDVRRYLPSACAHLSFEGQPIRIVDLVSHTSGLPKNLPAFRAGASPQQLLHQYAGMSRPNFVAALAKLRLTVAPGVVYAYSNTGAQLAGLVLEQVYGTSYDTLIERLIATPLHMATTGTVLPDSASARFAGRYNGEGVPMPELAFWRSIPAAGFLKSTIADQLAYLAWNLDERDPVVKLAHTPTFRHTDERGDDIGMFWFLNRRSDGHRLVRHGGGSFGTTTFALLYPDAGIGVVLLANDAHGTTEQVLANIADRLADQMVRQQASARSSHRRDCAAAADLPPACQDPTRRFSLSSP